MHTLAWVVQIWRKVHKSETGNQSTRQLPDPAVLRVEVFSNTRVQVNMHFPAIFLFSVKVS